MLIKIGYTKNGVREDDDRTIIPTHMPIHTITALDVTNLSIIEQERLSQLYEEYEEYYQQVAIQFFNFKDWISHTQNDLSDQNLPWRTFIVENTEFLD